MIGACVTFKGKEMVKLQKRASETRKKKEKSKMIRTEYANIEPSWLKVLQLMG